MKKMFALILAAALVLALVPMTAMADATVTSWEDFKSALAAGGTVTLGADLTATDSAVVPEGKTVVLDLNGHTISMSDSSGAGCYLLENKGKLTIRDGSAAQTGKITFVSSTPSASNSYSTSTIGNAGTLVVESGTIENTTSSGPSYAIDTIWYTKDVSITINGGLVKAQKVAVRQVLYSKTAKNTVTVTGGTLSGYAGLQTHNFQSGGCLAEVNIEGGTLSGTYSYYTSYTDKAGHAGTDITISGGEFNGYLYVYNGNNGSDAEDFAGVSIEGGTFNDGVYVYTKDSTGAEASVPAISGGEFAEEPDAAYVEEGALVIDTNQGDTPYMIGEDAEDALASGASSDIEVLQAPANEDLQVAPGVTLTNGTDGDIKVNGETVEAGDEYYQDPPSGGDDIPETGDGMGLFVLMGLVLLSLLGMAIVSKRGFTRA